ncbi:hypothetical protein ATI61_107212 [Archangium gephyra]|uniref:Glutamate synthase [NADPH] large chain n=1 Tax=Archangium gephyra TaxID=48 RepID=A0AAC8QHV5_9BACT|nr:hypothetical protein [Archangium gephyra]AKJ07763.1 Glutamate synthase [NADPH] large chain [Archangium gephyra]REG29516.1 hypothetical protein ATI61_107212 [Archangium gephyra]
MYQRGDIKEGMTVRSIDGHKLGKVYAVGDSEFHIEKGLFFPKDYSVRYAEISDLRNGEIILAHGKDSLRTFSDEVPYGSDTIAQREGFGNARVQATDGAWMNQGDLPRVPFNARPEELRTQDLGPQEIGPYNTEGARASPILTEEDRHRGIGIPIHREVVERPVMRASEETGVTSPPLRAEEESARERAITDDELLHAHDELYGDGHMRTTVRRDDTEGTRKLDLSGDTDPKNKRGI